MSERDDLLNGAAVGFGLALLGLSCMVCLILFGGEEGATAIDAIAGLNTGVSTPLLRYAAAADLLLPIGYTVGICLMAAALAHGQGAVLTLLLTVLGFTADLVENGLTLAGLAGAPVASFAKFAALAAAGVTLVTLFPDKDPFTRPARLLGWLLIPVGMAAVVADLPLAREPLVFVVSLFAVFGVLLFLCLRYRA